MKTSKILLLAGAACFALPQFAHANIPTLSGEVLIEIQNEFAADADDPDADEQNNMFATIEVAPTLQINDNLSIDGMFVFEPMQDFDARDDNYFEEQGLFVEEIKINYERGPWGVFAGKFNPGFGMAWDAAGGIWGVDFAEDYEITEKIGVGGAYTFEDEQSGVHTLTASTFFADTTFLSDSAFTSRGDTDQADGGVSNTEDFSSFVVSLEGGEIAGFKDVYYGLAYRHQAESDQGTEVDDETGYVLTLGYATDISARASADLLLEYTDISHFEGGADDNEYLTASLTTTWDERWNLAVSYTSRDINVQNGADVEDHLLQVTGGYDFGQGTTLDLGWRSTEEAGSDTDILGFLLTHSFEF